MTTPSDPPFPFPPETDRTPPTSCSINERNKKRDPSWRAPNAPLKARRYDTAVEGPLTNAKIFRYALAGRYGEVIKLRAMNMQNRAKRGMKKLSATQELDMQNKVAELLDGLL